MDEIISKPQAVSPRYSFRYNGKALRIYHDDALEQVTLPVGGTFNWSEDNKGYSLTLTENKQNGFLEAFNEAGEPIQGPPNLSGIFVLGVNDKETGETTSTIEIKP